MKSNSLKTTFTFASLSLIFIFAASASPIPTYVQLQDRFKISNGTISMTAVCYFLGSIIALVIFSRLSDYIGRKFVAIITVMLSLVGLGLLATLNNGSMLLLARFIQGLSCGLGSSTLSILIIESGRDYSSGFVSAVAGLLSGLVAEVEPNFQSLTYYILMVVLVLMLLGLMHSAETVTTRHGAVKSLKPQLNLPDSIKKLIVPATGCFVATWALGGYFQAFSATVSKTVFNLNSPLVAAIVLVAYMAPNMFGSRISSGFSMFTGQLFGMSTFVLSALLMGVGILLKSFSLFLVMVIIASIMQGISYTTSMNGLLKPVLQTESTGVISVIYIISYAGAGIPSFVAGQLSRYLNFYQVTFAYIIFVSLVGVFVILNVLLQQHKISSSV